MGFVRCMSVEIAVEFDCCQLAKPSRSSMVANCLHEQLLLVPALGVHIRVPASVAILEFCQGNYIRISMFDRMEYISFKIGIFHLPLAESCMIVLAPLLVLLLLLLVLLLAVLLLLLLLWLELAFFEPRPVPSPLDLLPFGFRFRVCIESEEWNRFS